MNEKNFDNKFTKIAVGLLTNVRDLVDWGIEGGHTTEAQLRLTVSARKEAVVQLHIKGLSLRQIAAAVGAGKDTISRDLAGANATPSVANETPLIEVTEKDILSAAKEIRAGKAMASHAERVERIAEISKGNAELGTAQRYPIIYADPPWRYENPPMGASNRAVENHYPTMTLDEIFALPVRDLAADDALLYLWATAPKLSECMRVIEIWGFEYRTNFVWVKDKIGMGYHARNQHELLLVARRGEIPPPAVADRVSSVVRAARSAHSEKPTEFYELIESFYPNLPKIELFSRIPRKGWRAWGNQVCAA